MYESLDMIECHEKKNTKVDRTDLNLPRQCGPHNIFILRSIGMIDVGDHLVDSDEPGRRIFE